MSDAPPDPRQAYWNELTTCKIVACYVKRYRDRQMVWIRAIGIFKAIVTSGTIGAWAVWKEHAFLWGTLLAAAQVLDAAKEFMPQTKNIRNASDFVAALESILIDARYEWYEMFNGRYDADEIMARWRKLAKLLSETEGKYFPEGLQRDTKRQRLAEADADAYFKREYGTGSDTNG